jgi:hypothetical protein
MASGAYPFNTHGVGSDTGENHALYNISINMAAYFTTDGNAVAGAVNPYSYKDFASLPTNKNDGLNLARGGVRYQKVLQILGTYSNYRLLKIETDSSADQDTTPTSLEFNILFENDSMIPSSGTSIDGSTTLSTKEDVLKDLIATAINNSYTENVLYYDPTHVAGTVDRGPVIESLTVSSPEAEGEIYESITVTRIGNANAVGDAEKPTDNSA